jgi:hypothetical protein
MARKKDVAGALGTFFRLPQTWIGITAMLVWLASETQIFAMFSTREIVGGLISFLAGLTIGRMT